MRNIKPKRLRTQLPFKDLQISALASTMAPMPALPPTASFAQNQASNTNTQPMIKILSMAACLFMGGSLFAQATHQSSAQLGNEATWFEAGKDQQGRRVEYLGQVARDDVLLLTASNGFFDKGVRSDGASDLLDVANGKGRSHGTLIVGDFARLTQWKQPGQTLRWHLWFDKTGKVVVTPRILRPQGSPELQLEMRLGEQTLVMPIQDALKGVRFDLQEKGKHVLILRALTKPGSAVGDLETIELKGPAMRGAQVLRARWRPAAVHGRYRVSGLASTDMWVMASRNDSPTSSYSPITTPFGYYGVSFRADQRSGAACNFSMWSKADLPLEQQAHLLALGSREAGFSGFGHEGTGVKPRGWDPFDWRPEEVVQCLRVERSAEHDTYYGYFLDAQGDWQLYAVGRQPTKGKRRTKSMWPGSFVEVPGPPTRQRSGDLKRRVLRKGWAADGNGKWQRFDTLEAGKCEHQNKAWGVDGEGWFTFEMGGLQHFSTPKRAVKLPSKFVTAPLPDYLSKAKVRQLYRLPASFGEISVQAKATQARLSLDLETVGEHATATVYYGTQDHIVFAPRELHGTERKASSVQAGDTWPLAAPAAKVTAGQQHLSIPDLKPDTKYFYRILITSDLGKIWTFETRSFVTSKK